MIILRILHSLLVWFVIITSTLAISIAALLIVHIFRKSDASTQSFARAWARLNLLTAGARVSRQGGEALDPSSAYIFAANHQSQYDIFVLQGYLGHDFRWMAKKELFQVLLWGPAMRAAGYIPVDRSRGRQALKSLAAAARKIAGGTSVVVFPEGTRSPDGNLGTFKAGGIQLAIKAGVPIVPVAVSGTYGILPKGRLLVRPGKVHVAVGEPIAVDERSQKDKHELTEEVRRQVVALLESLPAS